MRQDLPFIILPAKGNKQLNDSLFRQFEESKADPHCDITGSVG